MAEGYCDECGESTSGELCEECEAAMDAADDEWERENA